MKHFFFSFLLLVSASCFLVSCKKGDTGPAGTANVQYSPWFTASPWQKDTVFGNWGFNYNYAVPAITQNILDSGAVLVFGKLLGYNPTIWPASQVGQLPVTIFYTSGGAQIDTWSARTSVGNVRIRFSNNNNIYNTISTTHQFRVVVIPGGKALGRSAPLSYKEVCDLYDIPY